MAPMLVDALLAPVGPMHNFERSELRVFLSEMIDLGIPNRGKRSLDVHAIELFHFFVDDAFQIPAVVAGRYFIQ